MEGEFGQEELHTAVDLVEHQPDVLEVALEDLQLPLLHQRRVQLQRLHRVLAQQVYVPDLVVHALEVRDLRVRQREGL